MGKSRITRTLCCNRSVGGVLPKGRSFFCLSRSAGADCHCVYFGAAQMEKEHPVKYRGRNGFIYGSRTKFLWVTLPDKAFVSLPLSAAVIDNNKMQYAGGFQNGKLTS